MTKARTPLLIELKKRCIELDGPYCMSCGRFLGDKAQEGHLSHIIHYKRPLHEDDIKEGVDHDNIGNVILQCPWCHSTFHKAGIDRSMFGLLELLRLNREDFRWGRSYERVKQNVEK